MAHEKRQHRTITTTRGLKVEQALCGHCQEWKGLERFGKDRRTPVGFQNWCKSCQAKAKKDKIIAYGDATRPRYET